MSDGDGRRSTVSLALNIEADLEPWTAPANRIDRPGPSDPVGVEAEPEWLELFAELFARPPAAMPYERIARLLCRTFRSVACAYSRVVDGAIVDGIIGARSVGPDRLPLPAPCVPAGSMTFVVGRDGPYGSTEVRLAATLWSLIAELDRRIVAERAPEPAHAVELTPRELTVLELLGAGLTAIAIARRLGISARTVHKHLERVYGKLGVTDRLAAVLVARRLRLVSG